MQLGECKPYRATISQRQCDINKANKNMTACPRCAGLENLRVIENVETTTVPKEGIEVIVGEETLVVMFSGADKEVIQQLMEYSNDLAYDIATIVEEFICRHSKS